MNEQIKERIDQVRRGKVPNGYKTGDTGMMPSSWKDVTIASVVSFYTEKSEMDNQYPVLTSSRNGLVFQSDYFEDQVTRDENTGYNVIPYGFITYRSRSDDGTFTFNQNTIIDKGIVSCFYPVFSVDKKKANDYFVINYLNHYLKSQILKEIVGTSQLVLSEKKLGSLRLPCPVVGEQEKIAKILRHCDKIIELKGYLIREKQKQKKWLMQNLLDPDSGVRIPVHGKGWAEVTLAECTRNKGEYGLNAPACGYKNGLPRYIRITDIDESGKYISANDAYVDTPNSAQYFLQKNDLLFVRTGATVGKTYLYDITDGQLVFAGFLIRFAINPDKVNPVFAKYVFDFEPYWKWVKTMSTRSGQPGINAEEYGKYSFRVPVSLGEQIAIARVLSSADHEIQLLEQELSQWQAKKMALMQLLLSGLVRVSPSQEG